jgi:mono/diheme cytochrome c family protein
MMSAKWDGGQEAAAGGLLLLCKRGCAGAVLALIIVVVSIAPISAQGADAQDDAKIAVGENVYNTYCATCHGDNLVNTGQTFDLRRLRADERPRFENSVRNGKNQMPPWRGVLNDEQIDQLWRYIRVNPFQK